MFHLMSAIDDLSLEFIILLMERRTHFRAVCVRVNRVGATLVTLVCAIRGFNPFPPVFERRRFWGPWVGDLYLTEEGALDLEHLRRCIQELNGMASMVELRVDRVHGASCASIINKLHVGGQWVPLMQLWRAACFPVQ